MPIRSATPSVVIVDRARTRAGDEVGTYRMGISGADFGALVEDLVGAPRRFKFGKTEKDQLLGALSPMKADIVEK